LLGDVRVLPSFPTRRSSDLPILILAVPVTDLLCAVIRRVQKGVPFYQADRSHFHHRLLELGFTQRQIAGVAYLITGLSAAISVLDRKSTRLNSSHVKTSYAV